MTFSMPLPIVFSFCALAALPFVLVVLSHGPLRLGAPGRRFFASAAATFCAWAAGAFWLAPDASAADWIAAALLLMGGYLAAFTLWTLIAWGFTLSMLAALSERPGGMDFDAWVSAYAGGADLERLTLDRLGVLLRFGLVRLEGGTVRATPVWGRTVAVVGKLTCGLFGVRP